MGDNRGKRRASSELDSDNGDGEAGKQKGTALLGHNDISSCNEQPRHSSTYTHLPKLDSGSRFLVYMYAFDNVL